MKYIDLLGLRKSNFDDCTQVTSFLENLEPQTSGKASLEQIRSIKVSNHTDFRQVILVGITRTQIEQFWMKMICMI